MGYCVSGGRKGTDIPGLDEGEVDMELRRESFVLAARYDFDPDSRIEIPYTDLPRLHQLIEFALRHRHEVGVRG